MSLNVAIHTNKVLPYSETFIKHHVEGLGDANVTLIGSDRVNRGLVLDKTKVEIINERRFGKLHDILFKLGVSTPAVANVLKNMNASLVHSHFGQNGYAMSPLATKLNIPHVVTFHGVDITIDHVDAQTHGRLLKSFRENTERLAKSDAVFIAVSDFIKDKLIDRKSVV